MPCLERSSSSGNTMVWMYLHHLSCITFSQARWECDVALLHIMHDCNGIKHENIVHFWWALLGGFKVILCAWIDSSKNRLRRLIFGMKHILACHLIMCWHVLGYTPWIQETRDIGVHHWVASIARPLESYDPWLLDKVSVPKGVASNRIESLCNLQWHHAPFATSLQSISVGG